VNKRLAYFVHVLAAYCFIHCFEYSRVRKNIYMTGGSPRLRNTGLDVFCVTFTHPLRRLSLTDEGNNLAVRDVESFSI